MRKSEFIYKVITHPMFVFPLFFIMLMANNGIVPLIDQDEAAYAVIASEMVEAGDYIEQSGFWSEIHRKPPLHTWFISAAIHVFGNNEFAIRFMTALLSWGTLLLIYFYGKALYHERIAMSAAIICGTCFLFPVYGKIAFTDGLQLFFSTWAAFSIIAIMHWKKIIHIFMFWVAIAFGVMVKGPPIIIFIGLFGLLTMLMHPNRKRLIRLHPWFFAPIALLPLFYWGYQYWQVDNGKTITWMYEFYIKSRAKGETAITNQTGFPGYYFFIFAFAFVPYFRYFLPGIWEGLKSLFLRRKHPELLLLGIWMASGWWLYEFIPSKLPSYALASLPAISLLMAHEMIQLSDKRIFSTGLKAMSVIEILLGCGLVYMAYLFSYDYLEPHTANIAIATVALLPMGSLISFIQQLRKQFNLSIYSHLIFVGIFWLILTILVYPKMGKYWDGSKRTAKIIAEKATNDSSIIRVDAKLGQLPSLPYYINNIDGKKFDLSFSWWHTMTEYQKEEPFIGLIKSETLDTLLQFVPQVEIDTINTHRTDRGEMEATYYLIMNDAARK